VADARKRLALPQPARLAALAGDGQGRMSVPGGGWRHWVRLRDESGSWRPMMALNVSGRELTEGEAIWVAWCETNPAVMLRILGRVGCALPTQVIHMAGSGQGGAAWTEPSGGPATEHSWDHWPTQFAFLANGSYLVTDDGSFPTGSWPIYQVDSSGAITVWAFPSSGAEPTIDDWLDGESINDWNAGGNSDDEHSAVAIDAQGNVYFEAHSQYADQVVKVANGSPNMTFIMGALPEAGSFPFGDLPGTLYQIPGAPAEERHAWMENARFAVSPDGALYIATSMAHFVVLRITPPDTGGTVEIIAGTDQQQAPADPDDAGNGNGGDPLAARLFNPGQMAFDSQGNLFIADHRSIRKVTLVNGQPTLIEQFAKPLYLTGSMFAVAVDACDNVYFYDQIDLPRTGFPNIIDTYDAIVRVPSSGGAREAVVVDRGSQSDQMGTQSANDAYLLDPVMCLAFDSAGNLWFSDQGGTIRKATL
jgi:hypothetical protein